MNTTTMRDRFLEEFEYFKDGNWSAGDELTEKHADYILDFIEHELKKERELKDQEHKAELEMIKGEIERAIERIAENPDKHFVIANLKKFHPEKVARIVSLQDTIVLLDSHINKQNL